MRCEEIQERLSAALDGELDAAERAAVDVHLAECAACRDALTALQSLDLELRRGTAPARDRTSAIAAAAMARLPLSSSSPPGRLLSLRSVLLAATAMACGFLLAVAIFRPDRQMPPPVAPIDPVVADVPPPSPLAAPAHIRAATGPVEVATVPATWTTIAEPNGFACEPGVSVRTTDASVCELETSAGATVRMNAATELAFVSADDVRLSQGEIWCRTPDASPLTVTPTSENPTEPEPVSLVCGSDGPACCVFTCPSASAGTRISVASGHIQIVTPDRSEQVAAGQSVEFEDGKLRPAEVGRGVLSERWMHPLLVRKGPFDEELFARVNALLAEVGRTKVSYLCERDLRSLGEYGALPLLRFLQSPGESDDAERRQAAAAILADVAPAWMTPELIELLADSEPSVRISAAAGLKRLTGETLGMTQESWGEPDRDLQTAINQWRAWWQSERAAFPSPPPGVTL